MLFELWVTVFFCRSTSSSGAGVQPLNQLLLPAPPATNGPTAPVAANPKMDLLSGDDYNSPKAETSLALVPVGEPQPTTPLSQQNALVLFDMFSGGNNASNTVNTQPAHLAGQTNSLTPQLQQQQNFHSPEVGVYPNGSAPNMGSPRYEPSVYMHSTVPAWNGQLPQQQQPASPVFGALLFSNWLLILPSRIFVCWHRSCAAAFSWQWAEMEYQHITCNTFHSRDMQ